METASSATGSASRPSSATGDAEGGARFAPTDGGWPEASGVARVEKRGGVPRLVQPLATAAGAATELRFVGTHVFDLLDKLANEAGSDDERRAIVRAVLGAVAADGAAVVRLWGSLKRTGDAAEVARAAELLELVLAENERRPRPLRFVVTLLNHQAGYGTPDPARSLDDQTPASGWAARDVYLRDGWQKPGRGQLADRITAFASRPAIARSSYVLAWELVNELDVFRLLDAGRFAGPPSVTLRRRFAVPALTRAARAFTQPLALGELRGALGPEYERFVRALAGELPSDVRMRLVWTSHVYADKGGDLAGPTRKLDVDLALAQELGLPFVLGELGQHVSGAPRSFCAGTATHDLDALFSAVLEAGPGVAARRGTIDALFLWGEGRCALSVPDRPQPIDLGVGGDSADLGPADERARRAARALRRRPRFSIDTGVAGAPAVE